MSQILHLLYDTIFLRNSQHFFIYFFRLYSRVSLDFPYTFFVIRCYSLRYDKKQNIINKRFAFQKLYSTELYASAQHHDTKTSNDRSENRRWRFLPLNVGAVDLYIQLCLAGQNVEIKLLHSSAEGLGTEALCVLERMQLHIMCKLSVGEDVHDPAYKFCLGLVLIAVFAVV